MENTGLIKIPTEMLLLHDEIIRNFSYEVYNMSEPQDVDFFNMVKLLCITTCLLVKKKIPLYMPDAEAISTIERTFKMLDDEGIDDITQDELIFENNEAENEILWEYYGFCEELPRCLTSFGWELVDSYSDNFSAIVKEVTLDEVLGGIKRLFTYPDFLKGKSEIVKNSCHGIDIGIYIFTNKRLGKYMSYALEHPTDLQLHTKIMEQLSYIQNVWGAENVTYSNKPDGYEVAYVLISDTGNYPNEYSITFASNIDFFLPIYAENLEKLLDRAYELYPIEK